MKNLLFTIFAFGSLLASGMAGPIIDGELGLEARGLNDYSVEHERSVQGLEARGSTDYIGHRRYVQNLFKEVKVYTGQMSKLPTNRITAQRRGTDECNEQTARLTTMPRVPLMRKGKTPCCRSIAMHATSWGF